MKKISKLEEELKVIALYKKKKRELCVQFIKLFYLSSQRIAKRLTVGQLRAKERFPEEKAVNCVIHLSSLRSNKSEMFRYGIAD